ncbi:hypothetical protein, partial [Streptomyces sp. PSKA30]|uniref:hypothetical protein n=1 Tax=Streptomyces sp. PSKA30 TaxID=2874597 RepID=UPI001CD17A5B
RLPDARREVTVGAARFSPVLERAESRVGRRPIGAADAQRPLLGSWKHDTDKEAGGPDGDSSD